MMRQKILTLFICVALTFGVISGSASAVQIDSNTTDLIGSQFVYLNTISPGLSISGGKATVSGLISGLSKVTKIAYTVSLQVKSGSSWSSIKSWRGTANGTRATYSYTSDSVSSGKTYRTKTVAIIYSGSSSETVTAYSVEKKA